MKPLERLGEFFNRLREGDAGINLSTFVRAESQNEDEGSDHRKEFYSKDGSRRYAFINWLETATPSLEIALEVETEGGWVELMKVSEIRSGDGTDYRVELEAYKSGCGWDTERFSYSMRGGQIRKESGDWGSLIYRIELRNPNLSFGELGDVILKIVEEEGILIKGEIPERINLPATIRAFFDQLKEGDFSNPKLITGHPEIDSKSAVESFEDLQNWDMLSS